MYTYVSTYGTISFVESPWYFRVNSSISNSVESSYIFCYYCRKIEIVQYAKRTRMFFVRLLALAKWAATADSLKRCDVSHVTIM